METTILGLYRVYNLGTVEGFGVPLNLGGPYDKDFSILGFPRLY